MQRYVPTLSILLGCRLASGCGDDQDTALAGLDGGSRFVLDGSVGKPSPRDAGFSADGRGPHTPPTLPSAPAAACLAPLTPAESSCAAPDRAEPNTGRSPARLELGTTCNVVQAWAADKDEDAYRFKVTRADPVRIELSYQALAQAELALVVRDSSARELTRSSRSASPASGSLEHQTQVFLGSAGMTYDLDLEGARLGTCLPYALRVDPSWCSDAFEDNDSETSAFVLGSTSATPSASTLRVEGRASEGDADFFQFTTPRADPVRMEGAYTVEPNDTLQLRRRLQNTSGLGASDVAGARSGLTESFETWLVSNSPGALFRAQISATGSGCASYRLSFDVDACSDAFEDNDSARAAAPIPFGVDLQASAFQGDDDFFDLSGSSQGGSCTASFTPPPNSGQSLSLLVFSGNATTPATLGPPDPLTASRSATVRWSGTASALSVSTKVANSCLPYSLRCERAAGPVAQ
ncbi:MAG: hypothetical protein JWN48_102 [Myxococcaceae bacterium]|nr:hypothetical protein [Myxococcaceae bacterium]